MNKLNKAIFFMLTIFLVTACVSKQVNHLGCQWHLPSDLREGYEGRYYPKTGTHYSISFKTETYEPSDSEHYSLLEVFDDGNLTIKRLQHVSSNEDVMPLFVVNRNGYEGSVLFVNSDYKNFIGQCD